MQTHFSPKNRKANCFFSGLTILLAGLLCSPLCSTAQKAGATMSTAIDIGTFAGGTFNYSNTQNNATINNFGNDYTTSQTYGQSSDDIFYKFTIQASADVELSHCTSTISDSYMHLLKGDGSWYASNDDYGPLCSGYKASIKATLAAGTYYIVSEGYSTNYGDITTSFKAVVQTAAESRNLIRTWTAIKPTTDPNAITLSSVLPDYRMATQYFDGLGRPEQTVVKQGSLISGGTAVDVVTPIAYDGFGREAKKYLPYVSTTSEGLYKANALQQQLSFNQGWHGVQEGTMAYGLTKFENSPLNRAEETFAPGSSWVGTSGNTTEDSRNSVKTKYWINTTTDAVKVWTVTDAGIGSFGTYNVRSTDYEAGSLYKNVTVDERDNQVIEFKDKLGKVILKKVQLTASADDGSIGRDHSGWLCTYYIYDESGQLRCVIQPKGVELLAANSWNINALNGDILNEQCFRYEYDHRGRMILKKVPGAGVVYMVYDARDRLVLTQDAKQRTDNKWLFTKYDQLNRPIVTGIYLNASYLGQSSMQAFLNSLNMPLYENYDPQTFPGHTLNNSFPAVNLSAVLTVTYYDDYKWSAWYGPTLNAKDNSFDQYLDPPSSTYPYPEPLTQSFATKGLVTGVWNNFGADMFTAFYYDEKSRLVQTKHYNITHGLDVTTNQYTFSGALHKTVSRTEKAGSINPLTTLLATSFTYDNLGRVTKIEKNLNNTGWKPISSLEYDALGQLKKKTLSPSYASNAGLESLIYDYNIRGWLLGTNRDYAKVAGDNSHYFGFDLGYDKTPINLSNGTSIAGYMNASFNGNIAGMLWKSKGDGVLRKYDFEYDNVNRLGKANFIQYSNGSWNNSDNDFTVRGFEAANNFFIDYDANGNMLSLVQHGSTISSPQMIMDGLRYFYYPNSNKLKMVFDDFNDKFSKLGDFKYDGKDGSNVDYDYDSNGNLAYDKNKKISGITYNHLNLPSLITIPGKGTIEYVYDASGNKLKKITTDNSATTKTITTTTTYIGGLVYESKQTVPLDPLVPDYIDRLQFISHEEGRVRPIRNASNQITNYTYDYFLKDHLGNVRMVLTEEQQVDQYPALSFEGASGSQEANDQKIWEDRTGGNMDVMSNRIQKPGFGASGNNSMLVRKSTGAIGAGKLLKVMSGDRIHTAVDYYYQCTTCNSTNANGLNTLTSALLNVLVNSQGATVITKDNAGVISNALSNSPEAISFFTPESPSGGTTTAPKAYMHLLLFNEQFKLDKDNSYVQQIGSSGTGTINKLGASAVNVKKNGYAYIYFSNESEEFVYFDNFLLTHERSSILEETHYYPFGLVMSGISSKAVSFGNPENKKKFNDGSELANKEFSDGSGLELYETRYRSLDPQIGRFWQLDPMADFTFEFSPYAYGNNNPILLNDPLGLLSDSAHPVVLQEVVVTAKVKKLQGGQYNGMLYSNIQQKSLSAFGYSNVVRKQLIPDKQLEQAFQKWIAELKALSKAYGYGATLAGGSVLDLKSIKEYKEFFKRLIKERKINIGNPAILAVATIMGIRSSQLENQSEALFQILSDYHIMQSTSGAPGTGIYLITESTYVGSMGPSGGTETNTFYDVKSKKLIGSTSAHY
jgi:RHS repeat-associated protein